MPGFAKRACHFDHSSTLYLMIVRYIWSKLCFSKHKTGLSVRYYWPDFSPSFLSGGPCLPGMGRKERPPAGGTRGIPPTFVLYCGRWSEGTLVWATTSAPTILLGAGESLQRETVATASLAKGNRFLMSCAEMHTRPG